MIGISNDGSVPMLKMIMKANMIILNNLKIGLSEKFKSSYSAGIIIIKEINNIHKIS
jgi:hypothetical protein